jgi:hypothetical protein
MKHFSCSIETIVHSKHRYSTLGDWTVSKNGKLRIKVSKMRNWKYEFLCGIHELIESALCKNSNITSKMVDKFDLRHLDLDEPGNDRRAPYHLEHLIAESIERVLASRLFIDWNTYTKEVNSLFKGNKKCQVKRSK